MQACTEGPPRIELERATPAREADKKTAPDEEKQGGQGVAEAQVMPWEQPGYSMSWKDPSYQTNLRATRAESRPGPEETGWTAWLRHHEDRKRWCTEQEVDLLMVGDSIVFGWSRTGKKVWEEYCGDRKAVNIGSSGDRTYHMLWHFQNGGLDGMKESNPKCVVVMIGTNNRGEPELKGQDTAYGILALLKEIHARLPESKILLLAIFPRGDTPADKGRLRNDAINEIIKTFADNETIYWLDIAHAFTDESGNLNKEIMPDGLHPNEAGYRAWAEAMDPMIRKLLGEPAKVVTEAKPQPKPVVEPDRDLAPQPKQLGRHDIPNPDFTQGDSLPEKAVNHWTLGATGARGWMYCYRMHTTLARQIYVTDVATGSPADGKLKEGDVLLGVNGTLFSYDPRVELGQALTAVEAGNGKLLLTRWRDGKMEEITLELPVLGAYSATAPYDCPKSDIILEKTAEALAERMEEEGYEKQNAIVRSLNGLGLLATGDKKYHKILKREAKWAADFSTGSFTTWWYGYVSVFLSEYILATGDRSVLPGLRRIAMEAAEGQSIVGSWGHKFANPDGRLPGYGMMNSPGAVLTLGLVLARDAGVKDREVATAIERSNKLLRFYIGKGSVPYGDHGPYMQFHEDNGKNGMVTVLFDQLGNEEGTRFFTRMCTASYGGERDTGHTGNFFNVTWAMPGVSRGGPNATGAWMKEFGAWYFDLARQWDGAFPHQGPPQLNKDAYGNWDATGMYLIAYAMPRKAIRLTGSRPAIVPPLHPEEAEQLIDDGRGAIGHEAFTAYDDLPAEQLLKQLSSWSPVVRDRTAAVIGRKKNVSVEQLIDWLDAPSVETRLGACAALASYGKDAGPAVPKLLKAMDSDHLWLRVKAAEALNGIGEPAMKALPDLLKRIAKGPTNEDPRGMEQRFLIATLFHPREGMLARSLDGVDRNQLMEAVKAGLRNEDGRTRGAIGSVYSNLSFEELKPILPEIHRAIVEPAPSGIMFDGQIQQAGLDLFSKHNVSEGIELIADYIRTQKKHGSENRVSTFIDMLKRYGAHAQRAIPRLEKAIDYFENEEEDFPKNLSLKKAETVRKGIEEIKKLEDKPRLMKLNL
jgi:lysophospholipase L1-like esterase